MAYQSDDLSPLTAVVPRFATLAEWLAWQETLHVREIDLGLERCREVARRLAIQTPTYRVIIVAGTNGKGSSVAMLDAILRASGYRTATYTSPHLLRYNERLCINGRQVSDQSLCDAFQRVDTARGEISLTYFEFGTLAALDILRQTDIDVAVLEVGLGGRLDAVNITDPDVALITAIDLDHTEWLGKDRETIALEKAGIMRPGCPAVCSDPNPPASLIKYAHTLGSPLYWLKNGYDIEMYENQWSWRSVLGSYPDLPWPALRGDYQIYNAAGVVMALQALADKLPVSEAALRKGLTSVSIAGRFQMLSGPFQYVLDVAHNPHGAMGLATTLRRYPVAGKTHAVIGMLKDKDASQVFQELRTIIDHWHIAGLNSPRAAEVEVLQVKLQQLGVTEGLNIYPDVTAALMGAQQCTSPGDRILITGSFLTVAAGMRLLEAQGIARFAGG